VLKIILFCLCVMLILTLTLKNTPGEHNGVAGFWRGLWHGLILPITFVISLFSDSVTIYEAHNNGGWYNLGFLLGVATIFGGGGAGSAAGHSDGQ